MSQESMPKNRLGDFVRRRKAIIFSVASVVFASIIAPIIVHIATNSTSQNTPVINNHYYNLSMTEEANKIDDGVENIAPIVTVEVSGIQMESGKEFVFRENGDVFECKASCLDDRSVRWSVDLKYMENASNGPFAVNDQGMAIFKFVLKEVTSDKVVIRDIIPDTRFSDPTKGLVELVDLQPGLYALGLEAVGAIDGYPTEEKLIKSTTGWKYYFFRIE